MRREGGVRVRASNRKPTTAGENASRYYSRTSKAFSFHSWELYLPLPTVRRTLLPPSLPVSHPRNAASTLSGFLATREIFLCVSRNASELFEAAEKKPRRRRRRLPCRRCRASSRKKRSRIYTSFSSFPSLFCAVTP